MAHAKDARRVLCSIVFVATAFGFVPMGFAQEAEPAQEASSGDASADMPQGEAANDEKAREAYKLGRSLFEQGKYEESAAAFDDAYQLSKRPLLLLSIASAYERAGRFDLALRTLRAYRPHANQKNVGEVDYRIASLEERMTTMESQQVEKPNQTPPTPTPTERSFNWLGWTTAGLGVAALGVGVTFIVLGEQDYQAVAESSNLEEAQALIDSGDTKKLIGYVSAGVGGAALIAGGIFLAKGIGTHEVKSETATSWMFAPIQGGGIVTLQGRF